VLIDLNIGPWRHLSVMFDEDEGRLEAGQGGGRGQLQRKRGQLRQDLRSARF
jgi:hypothetical protein